LVDKHFVLAYDYTYLAVSTGILLY
jgi:hypothetical protein